MWRRPGHLVQFACVKASANLRGNVHRPEDEPTVGDRDHADLIQIGSNKARWRTWDKCRAVKHSKASLGNSEMRGPERLIPAVSEQPITKPVIEKKCHSFRLGPAAAGTVPYLSRRKISGCGGVNPSARGGGDD